MRFKTMLFILAALALLVSPVFAKEQPKTSDRMNVGFTADARDYMEGFEGAFPPAGWSQVITNPANTWIQDDISVFEGVLSAHIPWQAGVPQDEVLSFTHDIVAGEEYLTFATAGSPTWSTNGNFTVEIDGGVVFDYSLENQGGVFVYEVYQIDLSAHIGTNVEIAFRYAGDDGADQHLDAVQLGEGYEPPPAPENDLCDGAIEIPLGAFSLTGDLTLANNDYDPESGGCTGYGAAGNDVVYLLQLNDGQSFDVSVAGEHDGSIYLITDCADPVNSCVAGADDTLSGDAEVLSFTNDSGATLELYFIVDAYSGGGAFTMDGTNGGVSATESATWSSLKANYR